MAYFAISFHILNSQDFAISFHILNSQGVIMNDEGDAVEFSPRNSRKVWSSDKKEVADSLVMRCQKR